MNTLLRVALLLALVAGAWALYQSSLGPPAPEETPDSSTPDASNNTVDLSQGLRSIPFEATLMEVDYSSGGTKRAPVPSDLRARVWVYVDDVLVGSLADLNGILEIPQGRRQVSVAVGTNISVGDESYHHSSATPVVLHDFGEVTVEHQSPGRLWFDLAVATEGSSSGSGQVLVGYGRDRTWSSASWGRVVGRPVTTRRHYFQGADGAVRYVERAEAFVRRHQAKAKEDDLEGVLHWIRSLEKAASIYLANPSGSPVFGIPEVVIRYPADSLLAQPESGLPEVAIEYATRTKREWNRDQIDHVGAWIRAELWQVVGSIPSATLDSKIPPDDRAWADSVLLHYDEARTALDHLLEDLSQATPTPQGGR